MEIRCVVVTMFDQQDPIVAKEKGAQDYGEFYLWVNEFPLPERVRKSRVASVELQRAQFLRLTKCRLTFVHTDFFSFW